MLNRDALFILNMLPEIGPVKVKCLQEVFPDLSEALGAPLGALMEVPRLGGAGARVIHEWKRHCDFAGEAELCRQNGIQVVTWDDEYYPKLLKTIHDPPLCLYVRGSLECLSDETRVIAIVGSRNMTPYGARMAAALAREASFSGWTVVSGLARGIDTASQAAVAENGGATVAVLGSGLLRLYPQENAGLASRIIDAGGAIVTEYPLREGPDRRHFPMRNRIISGLSRGVVVVEAGMKSGSLITASQALEQGRTVFAVPGNADRPFSGGCHALLKDGARLVEAFNDVVDEFMGSAPVTQTENPEKARLLDVSHKNKETQRRQENRLFQEKISVSREEYEVWDGIGEDGCSVDELMARLDVPASSVLGTLLLLEMKHLICQLPGQRLERETGKCAFLEGDGLMER